MVTKSQLTGYLTEQERTTFGQAVTTIGSLLTEVERNYNNTATSCDNLKSTGDTASTNLSKCDERLGLLADEAMSMYNRLNQLNTKLGDADTNNCQFTKIPSQ